MRLEKYHGLGNDFLILLDLDDRTPVDAEMARALCERRRGVGADGIIRVTSGRDGCDVTMELRNADGSRAEMSGNGIRCLARAAADVGLVEDNRLLVRTDAGPREVLLHPDGQASVDMGTAKVEPFADGPSSRSALVDIGNPHLVFFNDGGLDLATLGRRFPRYNVELVSGGGAALTMQVWERGVGETEACGTGAAAAAAAANSWGIVGKRITVRNPGGELAVELGDTIVLTGPAEHICTVEVAEVHAAH